METKTKNSVIVIISCVHKEKVISDAIIFDTFDEALRFARSDAEYYKHLALECVERVGIYKNRADIRLIGKYINKTYRVSTIGCSRYKIFGEHYNTFATTDYTKDDILF